MKHIAGGKLQHGLHAREDGTFLAVGHHHRTVVDKRGARVWLRLYGTLLERLRFELAYGWRRNTPTKWVQVRLPRVR